MKIFLKYQLLIVILCLLYAKCFCGTCPAELIVSPCTCQSDTIVCSGLHSIDLRQVFANLSKTVADKNFGEFVLSSSGVTELADGVFSDITFKKISINNAVNLNRISAMALNASALTAEEFRQMGENKLSDTYIEELFSALSSLTRINRIYLDLIDATKIPDHAFKIINGRQTQLESIHLNYIGAHYGHLKSVGNYPFYYLDNLKFISLANQPISHLSANSFDFEVPSKTNLEIRLEATQLTSTSFESGIFLNAKRPLTVSLSHNKITYLDESVFKPVFAVNETVMVTLVIEDNPLVCDCKNKWLTADKTNIMYRLLEPECVDGRSVWNLSGNDFGINC